MRLFIFPIGSAPNATRPVRLTRLVDAPNTTLALPADDLSPAIDELSLLLADRSENRDLGRFRDNLATHCKHGVREVGSKVVWAHAPLYAIADYVLAEHTERLTGATNQRPLPAVDCMNAVAQILLEGPCR